jgi:MobA/MobL family
MLTRTQGCSKEWEVAHLHFRRTVYKSGGGKAARRIAYITRTEGKSQTPSARQLKYIAQGREDLVAAGTRNLPAWAPDAHTYFAAAEQYEGANRVAFEEWKITLPVELSREANLALVQDLLDTITGERLPCTWAMHAPLTLDGTGEQPHLHLLLSSRMNDAHTRTPDTHFKLWQRKAPEHGGAQKDPAFWSKGAVKAHRLMVADMLNLHLEAHGLTARVDPETLARRGLQRQPEPKLLPSESAAYREKGEVSETMGAVLKVRGARTTQRTREENNAYQAWEERKAFLGITRDMTKDEKVSQVLHKRHGTPAQVAARYQPHRDPDEGRELTEDALQKRWSIPILGNRVSKIYHLPTHANYGDVGPHNQVRFASEGEAIAAGYRRARNAYGVGSDKAMVARESRSAGRAAKGTAQTRTRSLAQQIAALTARLEGEEQAHGRGVRVKLWDREKEQGMSW